MSKRTVTLLITVAALAAVLIVFFVMKAAHVGETPVVTVEEDASLIIAEYDYKNVSSVSYTRNGTTISLTYNDNTGKWVCEGHPKLPINLETPAYMASAISSIHASRFIEETDEHFADFGLDDPLLSVTITYNDGVSATYHVGNYNGTTDTNYFNVGGTNRVYTIAPGLIPYFSYSLLDLCDADTLPTLYDTVHTLKSVTIGDLTLDEAQMETFRNNFAKVSLGTPIGFAESDDEKASYGLDSATAVIIEYDEAQNVSNEDGSISSTVHVNGTLTLTVGGNAGADRLYCMVDNSVLVYAVDASILTLYTTETTAVDDGF